MVFLDYAPAVRAAPSALVFLLAESHPGMAKVRDPALAYGTPDFASRAGLEAILGHEQFLLEELRAADIQESGGAAAITFDADPM
ncbi:MAG TPA: hypothetical protein DDY78_24425 [Planctomycetales bacterium]|nr:hypothetical protein [Planctomycetales bacterium]